MAAREYQTEYPLLLLLLFVATGRLLATLACDRLRSLVVVGVAPSGSHCWSLLADKPIGR